MQSPKKSVGAAWFIGRNERGLSLPGITFVLADDSGLEVFSLKMRPGVFSARYAGEKVSYEANNRKLLSELHTFPRKSRSEVITIGLCPRNAANVLSATIGLTIGAPSM